MMKMKAILLVAILGLTGAAHAYPIDLSVPGPVESGRDYPCRIWLTYEESTAAFEWGLQFDDTSPVTATIVSASKPARFDFFAGHAMEPGHDFVEDRWGYLSERRTAPSDPVVKGRGYVAEYIVRFSGDIGDSGTLSCYFNKLTRPGGTYYQLGTRSQSITIVPLAPAIHGDVDKDGDVDNADCGKAAGSFGGGGATGMTWEDGDMTFDGDVDGQDFAIISGNFIGAMPGGSAGGLGGNKTDGPDNADLIYDPATGNVKLDPSEAAGARIVSFQMENGDGTFRPENYISLFGTSVFGYLEDVAEFVVGDTDTILVGFDVTTDLGDVFPPRMDLDALEAYLTTAVYTGGAGSGQKGLDLIVFPELGDIDGDGDIDNADIGRVAGLFTGAGGTGMSYADGDIDGDGDVDNADLGFVGGAFTGAIAGGGQSPPVPEPASLSLLALGGLVVLGRRRRA